MLATLNLLSTTELTLNDQTGSVTVQTGVGGQDTSSFTDLLRVRVDSDLLRLEASGEFLPEKGSMLPLPTPVLPLPVATQQSGPVARSQPQPLTARTAIMSADLALDLSPLDALALETLALENLTPENLPIPVVGHAEHALKPLGAAADEVGIKLDLAIQHPASRLTVVDLNKLSAVTPPSSVNTTNIDSRKAAGSAQRRHAADTTILTSTAKTLTRPPEIAAQPLVDARPSADLVAALPASNVFRRHRSQFRAMPDLAGVTLAREKNTQNLKPLPPTVETPLSDIRQRLLRTSATSQTPIQSTIAVTGAHAPESGVESLPMTSLKPATVPELMLAPIKTLVSDSLWGDRVSERVLVMAGNQLRTAEIRLTPAELGPLRVQVSVDDGAANVTFHAQQIVTREALEQALPRLREMLAEIGLTLGQTNVGEHGVEQGNRHQDSEKNSAPQSADDPADNPAGDPADNMSDQEIPQRQKLVVSNGRVDTFA